MKDEKSKLSALLQLIENAPNPIVKKTLILKLSTFPLAETENIFLNLFDDFDERIIAATIEALSSYQKIAHFDYFAKFSTTRSTIVKSTLARAIWVYDITEKVDYCRKIVAEGQKDKFNFVSELLRGLDVPESLIILDELKLKANSEVNKKVFLYQTELRERISHSIPIKTLERKNFIFIAFLIVITLGICIYFYNKSYKTKPEKIFVVKKTVLTEKKPVKKKIQHQKKPAKDIVPPKKKIFSPKKKIKKRSPSTIIQALLRKKKYLEAQQEMIKIIPKIEKDSKFYKLLINVNKKLKGAGIDEIISAFNGKIPISFYIHQVRMAAENKKNYIDPLKNLTHHPAFSLKIIFKAAFNKSTKDKALSSSFLKKQSELKKHFFLNIIHLKYENAVTIFERINDKSFKEKFKKLHGFLNKEIKYKNLNSEPFKYYSLQLNVNHFHSVRDFKAFKTILIYLFRGKLEKALKVLQDITFKDPSYKTFLEGIYYSRYLSDFPKSIGKLLESLKSKPLDETEIKFFLGKAYFNVGFYDISEKFLNECQTETKDSIIRTLAHDYIFSIYRKQKNK